MSKTNRALAQRIIDRLDTENDWLRTLGAEDSESMESRRSSTSTPGPGRSRLDIIESVLDGHLWPEFDFSVVERLRDVAEELGLRFSGPSDHFRYQAHIEDPLDWAYAKPRLLLFFHPSGVLIAAHGKHGVTLRNREGDPAIGRALLTHAIHSLRAGRAKQLAELDENLSDLNRQRADRGLDPMTMEEYRRNR